MLYYELSDADMAFMQGQQTEGNAFFMNMMKMKALESSPADTFNIVDGCVVVVDCISGTL